MEELKVRVEGLFEDASKIRKGLPPFSPNFDLYSGMLVAYAEVLRILEEKCKSTVTQK